MITIFLIIGLILSLGLNITAFILFKIFLSKINTYEEYIVNFRNSVKDALKKMRDIDNMGTFATRLNDKGVFESTDDVGQIFKDLEDIVEKLNKIIE